VEELSKQVKEKGLDRYEKILVVGGQNQTLSGLNKKLH